ncbi:MAG: hypothetical protein ACLTCQ_04215 [Enterocloster bolteae]
MRTIYRAGILTAALMVLVLGGCSGFDRGERRWHPPQAGARMRVWGWMQARVQMQ